MKYRRLVLVTYDVDRQPDRFLTYDSDKVMGPLTAKEFRLVEDAVKSKYGRELGIKQISLVDRQCFDALAKETLRGESQ